MNRQFDRSSNLTPALDWRVLGLLNLYRVLVPLVLLAVYPLGGTRGFPVESPQLFFGATVSYLCFGLGSIILVRRRLASVYVQTILQATVDLTLLMLVLHACGGIAGGLGLLLLLPVGGLAFLLPSRSALFLAAIAAFPTVLINQTNANFFFGGTSILIVIGVALDTMKQLEAQLMMRNYEGFLK